MANTVAERLNALQGAPKDTTSAEEAGVASLRALLLSPEPAVLAEQEQRLQQLEDAHTNVDLRTEDVSEVLVNAIQHRNEADGRLGDALRPLVETQFHKAAHENVDMMAEAIFPVLGPAVRKLVADMISPKTDGLPYHIEQLFLIDNPSGLPMAHACLEGVQTQDADMVSGMLSAIKSYVNDAFNAEDNDGLDHLQVGDFAIWIEWGPQAVMAAVVRGAAPPTLRVNMQELLEALHLEHGEVLREYEGDDGAESMLSAPLDELLQTQNAAAPVKDNRRQKILSIGAALLIAVVGYVGYSIYDSQRWNDYLATLQAEPGVIILQDARGLQGYRISGLLDPLAADPLQHLNNTSLDASRITFNWSPVASLDPQIVLARAIRILAPPSNITLSIQQHILTITGRPSPAWLEDATRRALAIPGITGVNAPYALQSRDSQP